MIIVKSYSELVAFFKAFELGKINLLIVESKGGLAKTFMAESILAGSALFFKGHATPLSIYLKLLKEDPDLIVFDDVETLLRNKVNTTLLKQICDTRDVKIVNYHTTAKIRGKEVPESLTTTARTLILTNDLKRSGEDLKALLSRAHIVHFQPSMEEILLKLSLFDGVDDEVLMAIEMIKDKVDELNLRTYVKAKELKDSGLSWRKYLYQMCDVDSKLYVYKDIEELYPKKSLKEKIKLFQKRTGKSERTYYTVKKLLRN